MIEFVTVGLNAKLGNVHLLLDLQITNTLDPGNGCLHFLRFSPQHVEIVAVELHGDLRLDTREHVRNEMGQRLLNGGHDSRNVSKRFTNFFDNFLSGPSPIQVKSWR